MIFLIMISQQATEAAFIVTVPPQDENCFIVRARATGLATLRGNFDSLDDDRNPLQLSVVVLQTNNQKVLYRSPPQAREGTFKVQLEPQQRVAICVQNGLAMRRRRATKRTFTDGLDRTVGLSYTVEARREAEELQSQNAKLIQGAMDLTRKLGDLINHHEYMRAREAKHREVVEETFSQLLRWILLEGTVVICMACAQVLYLRRFLERRRYV